MVTENLNQVRENIKAACEAAGRDPKEVTLIAVSKTKPVHMLQEAYDAGARVFGENKVQEITDKYPQLPKDIQWHMIGHLQRNKVKYIAEYITMIHSVDSYELAETIDREAARHGRAIPVLIEVNAAQEESKFGVSCEDADAFIRKASALANIRICGLMTSAPLVENPEDDRIYFKKLSNLSVDINSKNYNNVKVNVLSMGMSNDFEVAVEEGSTMVRVGTSIFGKRDYSIK